MEQVSHYELRRRLGRGGMGEVYEAFDLKARRLVALKFVAPELAEEPEALRRFEAEALNAAALNHPHIATLYEFEPEGKRPFIAMELVQGPTLRERVARGAFAIPDALVVARDVAFALANAHRRGIVHRDIKPENLMFDDEGRVKVMDFGLARALDATRLTVTGTSMGTACYMAPESLVGKSGPPADVWALGLVLAEMITGQRVFQGESPLSEMYAVANLEPPPLRQSRADTPEAVERLVQRMIDKKPDQRPDAAAAAKELAELTGMRWSQVEAAMPPGPAVARAEASAAELRGTAPMRASESAMTAPMAARASESAATLPLTPAPAMAADSMSSARVPERSRRRLATVAVLVLGIAAIGAFALIMRSSAAGHARRLEAVALNNRALEALRRNDLDAAQGLVTQALAKDREFNEALFNRAVLYDRRGQLDSAAAVYEKLARTNAKNGPFLAMVLYNLGDLDLRMDAPDQAVTNLSRSFASDSSRWETYNNLGYALIHAGKPAEALPLLERGTTRFSGAAPLYKNAALALAALDREHEALARLDQALELDARLTSARGLRAKLRARQGDRAGALADWGAYLRSLPPPDPADAADIAQELTERGIPLSPSALPPLPPRTP